MNSPVGSERLVDEAELAKFEADLKVLQAELEQNSQNFKGIVDAGFGDKKCPGDLCAAYSDQINQIAS